MEAGLIEIARSLNRSWIYDIYFSLYIAIHQEGSPGQMSGAGQMSWIVDTHGYVTTDINYLLRISSTLSPRLHVTQII